jgi:hypothetical protein
VEASASVLPFFALFGTLFAAWCVIDLEYFPKWNRLNRTTRVWFAISIDLWAAGLILLWLEPHLAKVIMVAFFAMADLATFLMVRDLPHCWRRSAGRFVHNGRHDDDLGASDRHKRFDDRAGQSGLADLASGRHLHV